VPWHAFLPDAQSGYTQIPVIEDKRGSLAMK